MDNYGAHKVAKVRSWLARHPRYHVHFTPTSGSWLNMVKRLFAEVRVLENGRASDAGPCAHVHRDSAEARGASVIGFLKGKSAIAIARLCGKQRNFAGEHFWARGYAVSRVGFDWNRSGTTSARRRARKEQTGSSKLSI
jgi:hypothetical protein